MPGVFPEKKGTSEPMRSKAGLLRKSMKIRIVKRFLKQKLGLEKCHYKPDLNMLKAMFQWTKEFEEKRPEHEERLT